MPIWRGQCTARLRVHATAFILLVAMISCTEISVHCASSSALIPFRGPTLEGLLNERLLPQRTFQFKGVGSVTVEQRFKPTAGWVHRWDGTGEAVWDAALILCDYLGMHPELVRGKT
eukprot:545903-Rhodomonas_salina.1